MSLITLPGAYLFPDPLRAATGAMSVANVTLDASGEKCGFMFPLPKAGTISKVGFHVAAVTSAQTLRVGIETIGADGFPSGSQFGGSAVGTQTSPAGATSYTVTLGTGATVASGDVGDLVAAVIQFDGTVGNLRIGTPSVIGQYAVPGVFFHNGTTWAGVLGIIPMVWVEYSDGSYADIFCVPGFPGLHTFNSGTAGADEYGVKFTFAHPTRCMGIWMCAGITAGGDYEAILYSDTTVLKTYVGDGDAASGLGAITQRLYFLPFETPQDIAIGTEYIIALRPTAANNVTLRYYDVLAQAVWDSYGGQSCHQVARLNQGAWTPTTTRRPAIGGIFNAADNATGGGGSGGSLFGGLVVH